CKGILGASHREGLKLCRLRRPARSELATLAEEGDTGPLTSVLRGLPAVRDLASSAGLLNPGQSVTVTVDGGGGFDHLSVAAMLIPTNDGFFALNGVAGPRGDETLRLFSPAYDAGSARDDELGASSPGPYFAECGGRGAGAEPAGGEQVRA